MNTKSSNLQYAINADPSNKYLLKQFKKQEHLIFITYQGKIEGVIKEIHQYTIKLKEKMTIDESIHYDLNDKDMKNIIDFYYSKKPIQLKAIKI